MLKFQADRSEEVLLLDRLPLPPISRHLASSSQLVTNILTLSNVSFAISHTRDLIIGGIWSLFAAALPHLFNQNSADLAPFGKDRSGDIYLSLSA